MTVDNGGLGEYLKFAMATTCSVRYSFNAIGKVVLVSCAFKLLSKSLHDFCRG